MRLYLSRLRIEEYFSGNKHEYCFENMGVSTFKKNGININNDIKMRKLMMIKKMKQKMILLLLIILCLI